MGAYALLSYLLPSHWLPRTLNGLSEKLQKFLSCPEPPDCLKWRRRTESEIRVLLDDGEDGVCPNRRLYCSLQTKLRSVSVGFTYMVNDESLWILQRQPPPDRELERQYQYEILAVYLTFETDGLLPNA
jgi:hypothetical protein